MKLCSKEACVVVLTEKDVWLRINGKDAISLKANHMALVACDNNIIDFHHLITHWLYILAAISLKTICAF